MFNKENKEWRLWLFVISLNIIGILGGIYLQSKGINVFALKGGS